MIAVPDEILMAYADGELAPDEVQALEILLLQDADLRTRLEPFVETRIRVSYAFEHMLHEPVPDRLVQAIARGTAKPEAAPAAPSVPLLTRLREALSTAFETALPNGLSPALAAGAASLLVVGAVSGWLVGRSGSGMIAVADGGLVASGTLADALEANPSGVASARDGEGATVLPVLSFRTREHGVCREYRISGAASGSDFAGLACRDAEGQWRLALHVETQKATSGHGPYQTATSANVAAVDALTETLMAGDAFGRDDEAALLANGWKSR